MIEALLVSNALLWVLVVVLACVVVALTRQVGVLHERIAPAGALAVQHGPEVGDPAPHVLARNLDGESLEVGGSDAAGMRTLLFFLSPSCPVCKTLLPTLQRIAREEDVRIVYASDGERAEHAAFVGTEGLDPERYVLSRELGIEYEVAKLPYAVLIAADGRVRAKGLVNTREHLESMFEAERMGVASLQDYLERERAAS